MAMDKEIIRVMGTDLDGNASAAIALTAVNGVSYNLSRAVLHIGGYDHRKKLKEFSETDFEKLEKIIKNPVESGIPSWMINRQKDYKTGKDIHITGSDITMQLRDDINRLRKIRSYRGIRHERGLPTRGQKTKSSFRHGATVGVSRNKDAKKGK